MNTHKNLLCVILVTMMSWVLTACLRSELKNRCERTINLRTLSVQKTILGCFYIVFPSCKCIFWYCILCTEERPSSQIKIVSKTFLQGRFYRNISNQSFSQVFDWGPSWPQATMHCCTCSTQIKIWRINLKFFCHYCRNCDRKKSLSLTRALHDQDIFAKMVQLMSMTGVVKYLFHTSKSLTEHQR